MQSSAGISFTVRPNPSVERTPSSGLRPLPVAAHVKRWATRSLLMAHEPLQVNANKRMPIGNCATGQAAEVSLSRTVINGGP